MSTIKFEVSSFQILMAGKNLMPIVPAEKIICNMQQQKECLRGIRLTFGFPLNLPAGLLLKPVSII